jgi:hypothetical protein
MLLSKVCHEPQLSQFVTARGLQGYYSQESHSQPSKRSDIKCIWRRPRPPLGASACEVVISA